MNKAIKLTTAERNLIDYLIEVCERDGWYYGNKEHFQSRLNSIRSKILIAGCKEGL